MSIRGIIIAMFTALALNGGTPNSYGADRYYMLVFGSQTEPLVYRFTHTFALFVKAAGEGDVANRKLETQIINWMPRSMQIRILAPRPELGANLAIGASLRWAESVGAETVLWGPYEITPELYDMAAQRAALLNANRFLYKANDRRFRGTNVTNCIHAVSDLDTTQPLIAHETGGFAGSQAVVQHFQKYILPKQESNAWLCEALKISPRSFRFANPENRPKEEAIVVPPSARIHSVATPQ